MKGAAIGNELKRRQKNRELLELTKLYQEVICKSEANCNCQKAS